MESHASNEKVARAIPRRTCTAYPLATCSVCCRSSRVLRHSSFACPLRSIKNTATSAGIDNMTAPVTRKLSTTPWPPQMSNHNCIGDIVGYNRTMLPRFTVSCLCGKSVELLTCPHRDDGRCVLCKSELDGNEAICDSCLEEVTDQAVALKSRGRQ